MITAPDVMVATIAAEIRTGALRPGTWAVVMTTSDWATAVASAFC